MAKGDAAKAEIVKKLQAAFGADFIGEYSKKYYVWGKENGEKVQIAISLTCPKVQVEVAQNATPGDFNFEDDAPAFVVPSGGFQPAEITDDERARVNDLMKMLDL